MKILVTGANGYLGQGIVKELLDLGNNVIATDISVCNIDKRATIIKADIFDLENPFQILGKPDQILHLAWKDGFMHNSASHILELSKHYEFIEKLVKAGIKSVSIMGTMHEVGYFEGQVQENTPCNPMSFYGISKNSLRQIIEILCRENSVNFKWLRSYYIVGKIHSGNSIFSKILIADQNDVKTFPFTSGKNEYDFLSYEDFIRKVSIVVQQEVTNGIIDICSGHSEKLSVRVETFIKENNLKIKLEYGVYPDRPYDSKAIWGDNKKILSIEKEYYEKNY